VGNPVPTVPVQATESYRGQLSPMLSSLKNERKTKKNPKTNPEALSPSLRGGKKHNFFVKKINTPIPTTTLWDLFLKTLLIFKKTLARGPPIIIIIYTPISVHEYFICSNELKSGKIVFANTTSVWQDNESEFQSKLFAPICIYFI